MFAHLSFIFPFTCNVYSIFSYTALHLLYYKASLDLTLQQMSSALQQLTQLILSIEQYDAQSIPDLETAIKVLDQIYEIHSKAIWNSIDKLIDIFQIALEEYPSTALLTSSHLLDFIVEVVFKHPKIARNNKNRCIRLLKNFVRALTKPSDQIGHEWENPPEGYSVENEEIKNPNYGDEKQIIFSFNCFVQSVGPSIINLFQPIFQSFIAIGNDWRFPYAALMLAAELGSEGAKVQTVHNFAIVAMTFLDNPNPKIRYACLNVIAGYSDNFKPDFQEKYFDQVVPLMVRTFTDPVPRVVANGFFSFSCFFDSINEVWRIESIIGDVIPIMINNLRTACSWVKEQCAAAICSLATTKNAFGPYLTSVIEIANEQIVKCTGVENSTTLANQCFELLSLIIGIQNRNEVEQYLPNYVNLLFSHRESLSGSSFLGSWKTLCEHYEEFTDLSQIIDYLIVISQKSIEQGSDYEALQIMNGLSSTCKAFHRTIWPFIPRIIQFAKYKFDNQDKSIDFKESAIGLIVKLTTEIHYDTPEQFEVWKAMTTSSMQFIFTSIDLVGNFGGECYQECWCLYVALKELVKAAIPILTHGEVQALAEKLKKNQVMNITTFYIIEASKNAMVSSLQDDDLQSNQSEIEDANERIKCILQSMEYIPEILQALLSTTDAAVKKWLVEFVLAMSGDYVEKTGDWRLFGINLTIALIESCYYVEIAGIWGNLMKLFLEHSSHTFTRIRISAVYGIGLIVLGTPVEQIQQGDVMTWLEALWSAYSSPFAEDIDEDNAMHCKENVMSTIGKILNKLSSKFPGILTQELYKHWLSKLPLNIDKGQGDIQQGYLIEILRTNPGLFVSNAQDLKNICVIYASFLRKRHNHDNKGIIALTKASLQAITQWTLFKQSEVYLWNTLSHSQIKLLTRLISQ